MGKTTTSAVKGWATSSDSGSDGGSGGGGAEQLMRILKSVFSIFVEVVFFWQLRLYAWWTKKSPRDQLLEIVADARLFEEWEAAAFHLDEVLGYDLWRQNPTSKYYDYRLIYERLQAIIEVREDDDILGLVNLLRSGLVRNLGNITAPRLFNRAYAGTKLLIEDYITQVALAIEYVTAYPTTPEEGQDVNMGRLTNQAKLDVLHDTRQAFGRSALVLQGGAIFGLCHLGVVKALHLRGLLPRIIAGTATGALIAALVGVHTEDELLDFLAGDGIDLSAFTKHGKEGEGKNTGSGGGASWMATLMRRLSRFVKEGYLLDVGVLEQCVRANVGDLTFEEAYAKTKRVLNITVTTTGGGVPNLLNYLTAPNVLIWSAALASNTTSSAFYHPVTLMCKSSTGAIVPWGDSSLSQNGDGTSDPTNGSTITFRPWTHASYADRESPLHRIAELFNVNHFIVSQARPYLAPFLRSDLHHPHPRTHSIFPTLGGGALLNGLTTPLLRLTLLELHHRLAQLDALGLLPPSIRRFLLDENLNFAGVGGVGGGIGGGGAASLTLVPELSPTDFWHLLWENPTIEGIEYWVLRGERSVWPAVGALKVRCAVEVELDRGYQLVRRRKPFDVLGREDGAGAGDAGNRDRVRASSFGGEG